MSFLHLSVSKAARRTALALVPTLAAALVVGCDPKDGAKEFVQGQNAYEVRDLKKADQLFAESLKCAPEDVDRILYCARVKLDLGELAAAFDLMTRAQALAGEDADVALLSAQVAWHRHDYAKATEIYTSLAGNDRLDSAVRAQAWAELGVVELSCESQHQARLAFLSALRLDRKNAAARYHLGFVYRDFGYLEAALEQFEIYVRLETEASPRVQRVQREVIPALKDAIAQALTDRLGSSKRNSAACSSALVKAEAAMKKGAYKEARLAYQDAVNADALSYPAALGLANVLMRTDSTKAGQNKAFENYRRACELHPSAITTFVTAGTLAMKLGLYGQAVEIYSRAVAASPTSYDAIDGLIRALYKVGNKTSVAKAYQRYRDLVAATKPNRK